VRPVLLPADLRGGRGISGETLRLFNLERVRSYLEQNLGCTQKQAARALGLAPRTVGSHVRRIRAEGRK
jgi:transcriptional regulator with GAF, ATPase, and Fis domain